MEQKLKKNLLRNEKVIAARLRRKPLPLLWMKNAFYRTDSGACAAGDSSEDPLAAKERLEKFQRVVLRIINDCIQMQQREKALH